MRISDWSTDVCSSDPVSIAAAAAGERSADVDHPARVIIDDQIGGADRSRAFGKTRERRLAHLVLCNEHHHPRLGTIARGEQQLLPQQGRPAVRGVDPPARLDAAFPADRSEEPTSELPSLMRISY